MSETWVKIIEDGIEYDIDEFAGLMFLDAKASYPSENENNVSINGIDGVLPGAISFAPFNLVLRFGYDGIDARELICLNITLEVSFIEENHMQLLHLKCQVLSIQLVEPLYNLQ